jgi:hypothetical protein
MRHEVLEDGSPVPAVLSAMVVGGVPAAFGMAHLNPAPLKVQATIRLFHEWGNGNTVIDLNAQGRGTSRGRFSDSCNAPHARTDPTTVITSSDAPAPRRRCWGAVGALMATPAAAQTHRRSGSRA